MPATLNTGTWYHVAATWDGTTAKIYINGVLDSSTGRTGTIGSDARAVNIGGRSGSTDMFDGKTKANWATPWYYPEITRGVQYGNRRVAGYTKKAELINLVAAFADAGSLWNYVGPTSWSVTGERINGTLDCPSWGPANPAPIPCPVDNGMYVRTSVGVGLIWDSPFGPLRFEYAYAITKDPLDLGFLSDRST